MFNSQDTGDRTPRDAEILSKKHLDELRYNLAHLSLPAVRDFYHKAFEDCRLIYDRLPSPKQNANARSGLAAAVEMALMVLRSLALYRSVAHWWCVLGGVSKGTHLCYIWPHKRLYGVELQKVASLRAA